MKSRFVIGLVVAAAAAPYIALAQPAPKQPPAAPAAPPPKEVPDDMAAFEKDLDALFSKNGLTAEMAAQRAVGASPTVRRRLAEIDAALANVEAAETARVPQLGAKLSYTRLSPIDPISFGPGVTIPFLENSYINEASLGVALSDYLVRFPKVIAAAKEGAQVAKITKRSTEVGAGQDARLAYYEWVRAKLQVMIARRSVTQIQTTLVQVRALTEVQRLSKADLLRVESQEATAEQVVDQLQNLADLREEQLRLLIGAPATESLAIGEDIRQELAAPAAQNLDQLLGTAKQQRLEFQVIDTGIHAKELQREAERANLYPRLSAFAVADYARPNSRVFPQKDQFDFTWQIGLQLTWNINEPLLSRTTEKRYIAETSGLRADRENLERGTRIELLAAQQAVALAQRSLLTSQKGLAASEEGYRVRKALLAAERATAVELVDSETDLTRARINALNARLDLRVALVQLGHALGNDAK